MKKRFILSLAFLLVFGVCVASGSKKGDKLDDRQQSAGQPEAPIVSQPDSTGPPVSRSSTMTPIRVTEVSFHKELRGIVGSEKGEKAELRLDLYPQRDQLSLSTIYLGPSRINMVQPVSDTNTFLGIVIKKQKGQFGVDGSLSIAGHVQNGVERYPLVAFSPFRPGLISIPAGTVLNNTKYSKVLPLSEVGLSFLVPKHFKSGRLFLEGYHIENPEISFGSERTR